MQRIFRRQLRQHLPVWVERGWVSPEGAQQIVAESNRQAEHATRILPLLLSVLGVILIGSGVITFVAAHWGEMGRLPKLLGLFGSLWLSYVLAAMFARNWAMPKTGQALLLLGVILFGANIMLIAQIYHIDAHYPDGVMMWALGGLLVACLMGSQPAMLAALGLAILWSGMETTGFDKPLHWPFLLFLAAAMPIILLNRWRWSLRAGLVTLLLWSGFSLMEIGGYNSFYRDGAEVYLLSVYMPAYLALFVAGLLTSRSPRFDTAGQTVQSFGVFGALAIGFLLTFPRLLEASPGNPGSWSLWVIGFSATVIALALWYRRTRGRAAPRYVRLGIQLIGGLLGLNLINLVAGEQYAGPIGMLFNIDYFLVLIWLVYAGTQVGNRAFVNAGFFFFFITLLARYFDTFWTLMDRSLFFFAGGVLVLGGGWWLERQRRRVTGTFVSGQGERP